MKILWVVKKYLDIAVDRTARIEMIKSLEKCGHKVILITGYKKKREDFGLGDRLKYACSISCKFLNHATFVVSAGLYMAYFLIRWRPDVVIMDFNTCFTALPFNILQKLHLLKIRFILDVRTIPVETSGLRGRIEEALFNSGLRYARWLYSGIAAISPFMKEVLSRRFNLNISSVGVWASGVSLEHFDPCKIDEGKARMLRKLMGLADKFVVVYHGTFGYNRGLRESIEAICQLQGRYPDIALLVIGDGPAKQMLKELVIRLSLKRQVLILDALPYEKIPLYIFLADVGILPFPNLMWWRVSSPLKLVEYLAMGKPVIVTDLEAHREVLNSHECGFFIRSNEPHLIAEKLAQVYELGRERLKKLGSPGRELVQSEYTWDRQAQKVENFLVRLGADVNADRAIE